MTSDRNGKLAGFAGLALLVACAVLLPQAYRDAVGGVPVVVDGVHLVDLGDGRLVEFGGRGQGPLPLVPPILLGVAGLVSVGVGARHLLRKRRGPGA
ncbi:hypothetical protein [Lentzea sp. NPDC051838]|uniref:hypothetical protein n=1 Tax=Lentzea sp. NPDC051838 TaxID=3154849 RepID=UPI003414282C